MNLVSDDTQIEGILCPKSELICRIRHVRITIIVIVEIHNSIVNLFFDQIHCRIRPLLILYYCAWHMHDSKRADYYVYSRGPRGYNQNYDCNSIFNVAGRQNVKKLKSIFMRKQTNMYFNDVVNWVGKFYLHLQNRQYCLLLSFNIIGERDLTSLFIIKYFM